MSRPRFLADEDLRGSIVRALRRIAPSLVIRTIVELNLSSASDEVVLQFAWQHKLLIVSHDVSTMKSSAIKRISDGSGIHGLFLVPQGRAIRAVAESLHLIFEASEFEDWRDQIVYLPF